MTPHGTPRPLTVFVADDDDTMRSLVVETLRAAGHFAIEARDGDGLLTLLECAEVDASVRPDVIVTDVLMPSLSGLGVLNALRRARWDVPSVVITALTDDSVRVVAGLGAVRVLRKPFDIEDLMTAVLSAARLSGRLTGR